MKLPVIMLLDSNICGSFYLKMGEILAVSISQES